MRTVAALLLLLGVLFGVLAGDALTVCLDGDDHCPPTCTHCVCCSHASAPGLLADGGPAFVLASERQEPDVAGEPSSGTSPDILHVPRLHAFSA